MDGTQLLVQLASALASGAVEVVDLSAPLGPETPLIKLPPQIVEELVQTAIARKLLVATGAAGLAMHYELSEQGRAWAMEALQSSVYAGPAPVTLKDF